MNKQVTIKQVRTALKRWGKFWCAKELGKGFSRQAATEAIGSVASRNMSAEQIHVPDEIAQLSASIELLRPECKRAIRAKYMMHSSAVNAAKLLGFDSKRSMEFWLLKAEQSLMVNLSAQ
ncbi:hypothetical protein HUZ36_13340 [Pseudoalteromonas sp. McH1-7]|uniref:Phage antitermination protein Q n=1 Tax=Pseudoalteromonas peptidolytica F12-50-A1 TaxID=1315280 RepID=A0A8I0T5B6_9GAMM|nr:MULTISPECIES: hypothetical protein [Pseudoalteromonas]MBE0347058.1 hypothetical protein [Pseudoalteromonas peptidolytica F12-50-A1]MDW7550222.1 hypothetical protein [Pseudoalteromonas peptidolytica]NLR14110.1 hypothetical protein [Pseudoalteromonas peptidolytica]NUZ11765.1 hypothetical protein [Pseudoalteromonas sp. McH1-7]RRS07653.1 hypothetical protein EAG18_16280 [Pseudoalteromonas sp. J010]